MHTALFVLATLLASSEGSDPSNVIDRLLQLPAPDRDWRAAIHFAETATTDERVIGFWGEMPFRGVPSPEVAQKLSEAVEKRPDLVEGLVQYLPHDDVTIARVRKAAASLKAPYDERTKEWLLHHDPAQRSKLVEAASKANDDVRFGYIDGEGALEALASSDWTLAEPVLRQHAVSRTNPRTRARALALLYRHDPQAYRGELQRIATDPSEPGSARRFAFRALFLDDWNGRDQWLMSRLSDPAMTRMRDGMYSISLVEEFVAAEPDRWIPLMTLLTASSDFVVRSAAVNGLARFHLEKTRADALRPIICWISEPQWAQDASMNRLRLVQSVAKAGLREAIPDLAWAVEHDMSDSIRSYAAEALADLHDETSNAALRRVLTSGTLKFNDDVQRVILAATRTNAFASAELATDTLLTLRYRDARRGDPPTFSHTPLDLPLEIGGVVLLSLHDRDDVVKSLIDDHGGDPLLMRALSSFETPTAARFIARSIAGVDEETLTIAIQKRDLLRKEAMHELQAVAARGGVGGAIATVFAGNTHGEATLLAKGSVDEKRALLAAARATREPLDIRSVASLFGQDAALDRAAEAFLIAEDSAAARAVLYARHPGEARIYGASGGIDEWEESIRNMLLARECDEIIGYRTLSWGAGDAVLIAIRGHEVTLNVNGHKNRIAPSVLAELRAFLQTNDVDNLPPLQLDVHDATLLEYVHVTRYGGARVFMNAPGHSESAGTVYAELATRLRALAPR